MNIHEARACFRDIVAVYFGDSHVFYAQQKKSRKAEPYISIQYLDYSRQFYPSDVVTKEGYSISSREITMRAQVDLYTRGRNMAKDNQTPVYANTSLDDMEDFIAFLDSENAVNALSLLDMSVVLDSGVRDLSALINDSTYNYRASADFAIHFTVREYGDFGQNAVAELPNTSGGGSEDMVTAPAYIKDVNIIGGTKE